MLGGLNILRHSVYMTNVNDDSSIEFVNSSKLLWNCEIVNSNALTELSRGTRQTRKLFLCMTSSYAIFKRIRTGPCGDGRNHYTPHELPNLLLQSSEISLPNRAMTSRLRPLGLVIATGALLFSTFPRHLTKSFLTIVAKRTNSSIIIAITVLLQAL